MFGRRSDDDLDRRVKALEREVAELRARLGAVTRGDQTAPSTASPWPVLPSSDPWGEVSTEVLDHLRAGRKINAIKAYREQYGVGLKEAKDAVDRLG